MADAKFTRYSDLSGGTTVIPDNTSEALDISSTDAKDYVKISTDDGSEKLTLSGGSHGIQILDAGAVQCTRSGGWALLTSTPSATVPNFNPVAGDPDTGIGRAASDELSLIAGGVEKIRAATSTVTITGNGGTTGDAAPTGAAAPTLYLESSTGNSQDRCALLMNGDGNSGSNIDMLYQGNQKLRISATNTQQTIVAEDSLVIQAEDDTQRIVIGSSNFNVQDLATIHTKNSADASGASYEFRKSRHDTDSSHTVVQDNDVIGEIKFSGSDGNSFETAGSIKCRVDGTPADGKVPSDLVLSTSPDTTTGGHTLGDVVERLEIDDLGQPTFMTDTAHLLAFDRYLGASRTNYGALRTDANGITMLVTKGGNSSNFSIQANYVQRYNLTSDKGFEIYNGHSIPSASVTDGVILYAEDVSSSSELKVRDEAGNITTLSPHNFSVTNSSDPMAWSHYGKNPFVGKEINVDMLAVVKAVEELSGKSFIQERDLDPSECRDWDTEEQARVAKSQEAIDEWDNQTPEDRGKKPRPELYVAQPKPDWMN